RQHARGGPPRKSNKQHRLWANAGFDEPGNAINESPGLTGSCSRNDQERPVDRGHRLVLRFVQGSLVVDLKQSLRGSGDRLQDQPGFYGAAWPAGFQVTPELLNLLEGFLDLLITFLWLFGQGPGDDRGQVARQIGADGMRGPGILMQDRMHRVDVALAGE